LKVETFQNYPNGAIFTGLIDEKGNRSGIGKYIWKDSSIYIGEFFGSNFNGYG